MAREAGRKRMTLSEHLALRAQEAEESRVREEARLHTIRNLRELDAKAICTCPACVRRRQLNTRGQ
jgi:hypothetical protein